MNFEYKKFPVTSGLIGLCIIVYLYTSIKYSVEMNGFQGMLAGGFNPVLVVEYHQFSRLITANFIHFGLMHLFCNCYSLVNLGTVMEYLLKKERYLIILISSALATTVLPTLFYLLTGNGASGVMGGVSGVIFGLMGALLALAMKFKNVYAYIFKQIAPSILLMLLISVLVPSISFSGHVSGMIGGFVATLGIIKYYPLTIWQPRQENSQQNIIN